MKVKISANAYLDMLLQAEKVLKDKFLLEQQAEIAKFNKDWFVRVGLCKKATVENYAEIMDKWHCESFWTKVSLVDIQEIIDNLLYAIKLASQEFKELQDVELDNDHLTYIRKILKRNAKDVVLDKLEG